VPKIEADEGAPMHADPRTTLARDRQHVAARIEPFHTDPAAQMLQVPTGTAPHGEHSLRTRRDAPKDLKKTARSAPIVFLPAQCIVDTSRPTVRGHQRHAGVTIRPCEEENSPQR
jgi:hypothetical protein